MNKKYRINTNWSLEGKPHPFIYDVIMGLFAELDKSLKTPLMQQSKSDEEAQKILTNPEGITIKELQIIDLWSIDKKTRREARSKLDWAYRHLSTNLTRLIMHRNSMSNRSQEKDTNIGNESRNLKSTIISQYEIIKKMVEDYEAKEDKSKKKLLTYIRKVYSRALSEAIENLFAMATDDTERAKIFPANEQQEVIENIGNLQEKIWSITEKSKQSKSEQQKNDYQKLELEKERLEKELSSLKAENSIRFKEVQQQLNNLAKEMDEKTSQGLNWVQIRAYLKEVKGQLEKMAIELNSNQQLTAQIEQKNK